jgi:ribosomal protein L37AE/L43A
MARGNLEVSQQHCPSCGKSVKAERNARVWGGGDLIMVVFTLGLWAVIKLAAGGQAWRCAGCGSLTT